MPAAPRTTKGPCPTPRAPRPAVALAALLTLAACAGGHGAVTRGRSDFPELCDRHGLALLRAIDAVEAREELGAAPFLLGIWRNPRFDLPERSRAAAALCAFGFPTAQEACLAVLAAWLPGREEASSALAIPRQEEMAFVREMALDPLERRLEAAGRELPFYDVNQGAPQMLASVEALGAALAALPPPAPAATRAELAALWPERAPASFALGDWSRLRADLLAELGADSR